MKARLRTLILFSVCLLSGGSAFAEGSFTVAANLYESSRPATGEQGNLRDFAASRNCLFVSWIDLDGDHWLDAWSLSSSAPQFVEDHPFGNINDDQGALVPIAHLKAPRDLVVTRGRLFFWSLNELWEGSLRDDCSISDLRSTTLSDPRNNIMNRFSSSGSYGVTRRQFLSDQEFNTLLGQGVPFSELERELTGSALINYQSKGSPFIVGATRPRGAQMLSVGNGSIGSIDEHPAILELSEDLSRLTVKEFKPKRNDHINKMWEGPLGILFNLSSGDKTLNQLINEILTSDLVASHGAEILKGVFKLQGVSLNKRIPDLLVPRFRKTAKIDTLLRTYQITKSMTVKVAVRKIVDRHLDALAIDSIASADIAARFSQKFLGTANLPLSDLSTQIAANLDSKLTSDGLQAYLVNTILRPLIDSPEALNLRLGQFLDQIANNPAANIIDGALGSFQGKLNLAGGIEGPGCFAIPGSSREFLNLLLVNSGPKLDPNGIALFELLKLANFYLDGNDFSALFASIEGKIKGLHASLSLEATTELFRALNLSADLSKSYSALLEKYFQQTGVRAQLSDVLTEEILAKLSRRGIKGNVKISAVLLQIKKSSKKKTLTVVELQKWMKTKGLGVSLSSLATDVGKRFSLLPAVQSEPDRAEAVIVAAKLRGQIEALIQHIFGSVSLDLTLRQAAISFVNARINPRLMGDFVSQTLGNMLGNMSNGIGLPSVLGKYTLAARGDCISSWRVTIEAAAAAAAGVGLVDISGAFLQAEGWLSAGVDAAINYFLDGMVRTFVSEIFQSAGGQYHGWHLRLEQTTSNLDLAALAGRTGRLVNVFTYKNQVIAVLREMGASFPDLGGSKLVTAVMIPSTGIGTPLRLDFDGWLTLSVVQQTGDILFFSGQREGGLSRSVLAVDLSKSPPVQHLLEGNDLPGSFSAPFKVNQAFDSTQLVVGAEVGGISILKLP